ncbi:MAG: uroporphyrinogen decarboxylase family protein [Candidatus Latescibacterota bacterium]
MTHRERFVRTLTGQTVDRVPFIKLFGGTNAILPRWESEHPDLATQVDQLLQFDGVYRGWGIVPVNFWLAQRGEAEVVEDDGKRQVRRWVDGTVEVLVRGQDFHHHTVEWPVKTRADWERVRALHLQADDPSRLPPDWSDRVREYRQRDYALQLTHGGVYGFARNLMGDEALLLALYDDPGLVHDLMDGYTDMLLSLWGRLVEEVEFDLVEFWEDMASKNGALLSPAAFRQFMLPNYRRVAEFARRHRIPVILVDSDGYTDELASLMVEGGVTAMYPFEVGAGCRPEVVRQRLPEFGIVGGLAKESMIHGRSTIDEAMVRARELIRLGRCIPGPDHFVLSNVSFANYRYFMERLREVVMTTEPGNAR